MSARIEVVSASAGTGKTYRLAKEMADAVLDGRARPEAIVAITYTNRAAAELARRLRENLLKAGEVEKAARIRDGYLGTVHAICQRLIRELAFDVGLSPHLVPAPEALKQTLYRAAVDQALGAEIGELDVATRALGMETRRDSVGSRPGRAAASWRDVLGRAVRQVVENRMDGGALDTSLANSWDEVLALLDDPTVDATVFDGAVAQAVVDLEAMVEAALEKNRQRGKRVGTDEKRHRQVKAWADAVRRGEVLRWRDLAVLAKRKDPWGPKGFDGILGPLGVTLATHLGHPKLHDDLGRALRTVVHAAGRVAASFVQVKASERLLDFEDMLAFAADLLGGETVREHLAGRFDLVLVDEFQDTSPVQLAAILGLCSVASRSIWVGDRKQAIFGFQGSDPQLMAQAAAAVTEGRPVDVLGRNFRSRPPLVDFCSTLFARALLRDGVPPEEVRVAAACPEPPDLEGRAALHLWRLQKAQGAEGALLWALAVARGVRDLLDEGALVRDHTDDPTAPSPVRPVRPGDIAILARRNQDCREVAEALRSVGLSTRVQLDGLNQEPLTWLLRAGLALLVDPRDRLAAAEVAWIGGAYGESPDAWLAARIAASAAGGEDLGDDVRVARLRALASRAWALSPLEAVDAVFGATDAPTLALGWPDPERSLSNLEALRGVARDYEQTCAARRVGATVAGLVRHVEDLSKDVSQGIASDGDAVSVVTWHKAKGLEWPVVVLTTLDDDLRLDPWELRVRPADAFDATQPLADRTLRWWPNPYELQANEMALTERAMRSDAFTAIEAGLRAEERRLVYVAFTRARDHLVLAALADEQKGGKTSMLDRLEGEDGVALLQLPWGALGDDAAPVTVHGAAGSWLSTVRAVVDEAPDDVVAPPRPRWFEPAPEVSARADQRLTPSSMVLDEVSRAAVRVEQVERIAERVQIRVADDRYAALGDAVHAFLAADPGADVDRSERVVLARLQLDAQGLSATADAARLVDMADALAGWLARRAPGSRALREWPVVHLRADGRVVRGEIDLLIAHPDGGWIVIDHKTFPGDEVRRDERLRDYAGQLGAYADAVEAATGEEVREVWVHLPVRGEMVRLAVPTC